MRLGLEQSSRFGRRGSVFGRVAVAAIGVLALLAAPATAGPTPDYGIDFAIIGDPGNRHVNIDEGRRFYPPFAPEGLRVGTVNYKYRMSRTELTVGQWFEFVNAYAPYYNGPANDLAFTSAWIYYSPGSQQYRMFDGAANYAADMGWRFAARYCNWLHNGKVMEQWAFENGAYDTSTFTTNPNGSFNDQLHRNPDAKFWIPNLDEWTKAMHWNPNKNEGEGGYWQYPNSSDTAPIPGAPGTGETNSNTGVYYDVGAYADVTSPWGLLDGSGGVAEWTEHSNIGQTGRGTRGSSWALPTHFDSIDTVSLHGIWAPYGLRLASVIPAPSGVVPIAMMWLIGQRQRSRRTRHEALESIGRSTRPSVRGQTGRPHSRSPP